MTARGAALLVAGLCAVAAGIASGDAIVTRFGLVFLVVVSGSWIACRENLRALEVEDAALPFWRKGMLVRHLRCGENADLAETTRIVTRGEYPRKSCTLRSTFPFGLFRCELRLRPRLGILVFPRPELPKRLRQQIETQFFEGENIARHERDSSGEFHGIRPFQPGDRCRSIHWPATVRGRALMVREWDRPQPEKFSVVFHSYFPPGRPVLPEGFDHAMELLSGLLFHCRELQIPMQFIASFADWETIDIVDPQELRPLLVLLARAEMRAEHSPEPLIRAIRGIPGHHRIYVISNVPLKLWAPALPELPHPVVCLDNREMRVRQPRLLHVRTVEEARAWNPVVAVGRASIPQARIPGPGPAPGKE